MLFYVLDLFIWEIDILMYQTCVLKWFKNLPLFYLLTLFIYIYVCHVLPCYIIMHVYLVLKRPTKVRVARKSHPGGGGVLQHAIQR